MSTVLESKSERTTALELEALRSIKYDWAMQLRSVWSDPPYDSAEIHTRLRQEFQNRLDEFKAENADDSPLGWLVVGPAGTGKTHWLSICRQQAIARDCNFVLVDMVGVREFWDTVLQGYLDSLQQEILEGKSQQQILTERFLMEVGLSESVDSALAKLRDNAPGKLAHNIGKVLDKIYRSKPESLQYRDVIRAILAMVSHDVNVMSAGLSWLTANPVDEDCRKLLGFSTAQEKPHKIIKALSWMMSLCGPTVVAFDQLDPIVAQLDPAAQAEGREMGAEGLRALSIIQEIANGLGDMRDVTFRTLTVVSCLEVTLHALGRHTVGAWRDRFEEDLLTLDGMSTAEAAASMLYPRVAAGCRSVGFDPPSPVWPLDESALSEINGQTPRELLKICESHRKQCLRSDRVTLLRTLRPADGAPEHLPDVDSAIDTQFTRFRAAADVRWLLEQSTEDERIAPILLAGCQCLLREISLPDTVDPVIDDFPGGKVSKPLHARIRLIDHATNDREVHYCFRALERTNAIAFQARLKAITNGSGIDQKLPFRHSVVLRTNPFPGGPITKMLLEKYAEYGGRWYKTTVEDVRTLYALKELLRANPLGLDDWLKARQPASKLQLFQTNCIQLFKPHVPASLGKHEIHDSPPPSFHRKAPDSDSASSVAKNAQWPKVTDLPNATARIPLGQRPLGSQSETVWLPLQLLEKHTVVLAGAGAGKTVLLKRLIEEAALAGIPSIVIDSANDLASLGSKWAEAPNHWLPDDAEKARRFHGNSDIIYWTPGRESGNHLVFEPLPDLAAVADAPEELQLTIDAAVDGLAAMVISGRAGAENKRGILTKALRFFAEHGGGNLRDFIALLCELPPEASLGINNERKLAKDMADVLKAKLETNPMLRGVGTGLDPAVLFGDAKKLQSGPRISLISLIGLASDDLRQQFVYQLGMALFAWIKRNPNPPGRPLRGLLIVDEAKDFVPAIKSPPSKASLQLLASQARKYHLGLLLATQNPKEIENKVIGNCATQFYGKASSPNSRQVIQDQLHARGGRGDDIAALKAGQFYVYNSEASMQQPVKVTIPMCLSQHKTLDESEVLALAAESRDRLA